MKKELAEWFVEACEEAGVECTLYENYSGRGMYGEMTTGVVVSSILDLLTVGLARAFEDGRNCESDVITHPPLNSVGDNKFVWDNMGLDMIVY